MPVFVSSNSPRPDSSFDGPSSRSRQPLPAVLCPGIMTRVILYTRSTTTRPSAAFRIPIVHTRYVRDTGCFKD